MYRSSPSGSKPRVVLKRAKVTVHGIVLATLALSGVHAVLPDDLVWLVTLEGGSDETLYKLYGPMSRETAIKEASKATSFADDADVGYMEVDETNLSGCVDPLYDGRLIHETEVTVPGMSGSKLLHITDVMANPTNNLWYREASGQKGVQKQHPINVQLHYGWKVMNKTLQDAIDATFLAASKDGARITFGDRVIAKSGCPAFRLLQGKNYVTGEQTDLSDPCRIPRNLEKEHGDWQGIMLNLPSEKLAEILDQYEMLELELEGLDSDASQNMYYEITEKRGSSNVSRVILVDLEGLLELD